MKNKKGFSLIELLIVIAIIGILAGIAIPSINKYLKNSKSNFNNSLSTELVSFTKSYYAENKSKLPRGYLDDDGLPINRTLLGASSLLSNNYIIGSFIDSEGNDCTNNSYVIVEKNGNDYSYTPCIVCDNGYKSDDTNCIYEAPKTGGDIKDNIPPRCSFTLKSGVLNKWTSESVVFSLLAEDNEELAGISLNNGEIKAISGSKFSFDVTFNETGTVEGYTATVDDKNAARRTCTIDGKIMIDKVVPTVNMNAIKKNAGITVVSNNWSNEGLNFKLITDTTGPSGYTIYYCKDTDDTCDPNIPVTSGSTITSYNNLTGEYYIRYKVVSGAGVSSSIGSYKAKVDTVKPSAPVVALVQGNWTEKSNNTWYNHNIYVSGKANSSDPTPSSTDNLSGIAKYQISTDNTNWQDWSYNSSSSVYGISVDGTTYRYIRAIDNAGNISDVTTKTIKIDKTPPTTPEIYNSSGGSWTTSRVTINATSYDALSGVKIIEYQNSETSWNWWSNWESVTSVTSSGGLPGMEISGWWQAPRDITVYIRAVDNVGNESALASTNIRIYTATVTCDCMHRSKEGRYVSTWPHYHADVGGYVNHTTAYLRLCKCSNGGVYNCYDSGWTDYAGETYGKACYVHTGYNGYTGLSYSWSNYPGNYGTVYCSS